MQFQWQISDPAKKQLSYFYEWNDWKNKLRCRYKVYTTEWNKQQLIKYLVHADCMLELQTLRRKINKENEGIDFKIILYQGQ